MLTHESLWQLADDVGIERRYWDIAGNLHETAPVTARAVLEALGIPAGSDGEISESIAMRARQNWQEVLPPVVVAREYEVIAVPIRLPVAGGIRTIRWTVNLESGEERTGDCDVAALPIEEMGRGHSASLALRRLKMAPLPVGYHELHLGSGETALLIVAPPRCFLPAGTRHLGIATQLYSLNSPANWGIGDFGDLRELVERASRLGAGAIGLNPLHALFLDAPEQPSPYSPSSRLFRNPLYLDVTSVPDLAESAEARALIKATEAGHAAAAARSSSLIDYGAVAERKLSVLRRLHSCFTTRHVARGTTRGRAFRRFAEQHGETLRRFATFQMLSEIFGSHDWTSWPAGCSDCHSDAVSEFQGRYADQVSFYIYLQWLCEEQLAGVAESAQRHGMAIGLYNDLAVSVDAASADHWANRNEFAAQLRVGAPPDPFNERGQEWGVVPLNPHRLKAARYAQFIALLRSNMRHAGALRIDHVMGWQRLFVIPAGALPTSGTYIRFPLDDLLAIAALESQRNRCLIIGEDLGTVPEGFRERMADANVLSCRVFYFEREHDRFDRPSEYPALASVSVATHDLPTLRGFWNGDDIDAKSRLGIFDSAAAEAQARAARANEKQLLLWALAGENLLPDGISPTDADHRDWSPELSRAVHLYLARTPSMLLMVQLDDLANELHQANLPGSTTEHPNWRRSLTRKLADILDDPAVRNEMATLSATRAQ